MMKSRFDPKEKGHLVVEFRSVARTLDCVAHHPPCVFVRSNAEGDFLGWVISVFSPVHREAIYLLSPDHQLALFPDLHEAMLFLQHERIFTFTVSSAS